MKTKSICVILMAVMLAAVAFAAVGCGESEPQSVVLATTTSTQDSGLLDVLLPEFEEKYNAKVKTLAVGTGEALEMGEKGDADVVLVHAKASEEEFVKNGYGFERVEVMHNNFIIVGPEADPAGIKGGTDPVEAFKKIAAAGAEGKTVFVSRGDDSGTHKKELQIWEEAGIDPAGQPWYLDTGQGMGETLNVASQKQGYTLTDDSTFVFTENLDLVELVKGEKILFNQYGVIVVDPDKVGVETNKEGAGDFVEFLTSEEGQQMIEEYEAKGQKLFTPNAKGETRGMGE